MKTLNELEGYIEENCISCTKNKYGRKLYRVELWFAKHLQNLRKENVWTEYICCEHTTKGDFDYDVPSWDVGIIGEDGDIHVYCEVLTEQ